VLDVIKARLDEQCGRYGTRKVFATREPSDNLPGLICRGIGKGLITARPEAEALLYAADRCEHIDAEILPQLSVGNHVLCDRYYFSNFAYQGNVSSLENLIAYNRYPMSVCRPDATVFIDVTPEECGRRRSLSRATEEVYENLERQRITCERYKKAFERLRDEENILMVDGVGAPEVVADRVWNALHGGVFTDEDFM
jgi:dTMP kinase